MMILCDAVFLDNMDGFLGFYLMERNYFFWENFSLSSTKVPCNISIIQVQLQKYIYKIVLLLLFCIVNRLKRIVCNFHNLSLINKLKHIVIECGEFCSNKILKHKSPITESNENSCRIYFIPLMGE
jgi:hypothetical protein